MLNWGEGELAGSVEGGVSVTTRLTLDLLRPKGNFILLEEAAAF